MPQNAWSDKDERQYEHVKESERERGRTEDRAKEIAARSVKELRNRARELDIEGRSGMNKQGLVSAIRRAQGSS